MGNECKKCDCGFNSCIDFKNDKLEMKFFISTSSGNNQNLRNSKIGNANNFDEIQNT